jgi:hypothetical protein
VRIDLLIDLIADSYRVYYDGTELGTPLPGRPAFTVAAAACSI